MSARENNCNPPAYSHLTGGFWGSFELDSNRELNNLAAALLGI
jgi:hypothetical protein